MTISRAAEQRILAHVAEQPRMEACGLLFGTGEVIERAEPAANVTDDPARRFEIDPAALFTAIRAERDGGDRLIGHYHSHPGGSAEPSSHDAAMALDPGRLWLIVADGEMRLWKAVRPHIFETVELSLASGGSNRH